MSILKGPLFGLICVAFLLKQGSHLHGVPFFKMCFNKGWVFERGPLFSNRGGCCKGPLIGLLYSFSSKEEASLRKGLPSCLKCLQMGLGV